MSKNKQLLKIFFNFLNRDKTIATEGKKLLLCRFIRVLNKPHNYNLSLLISLVEWELPNRLWQSHYLYLREFKTWMAKYLITHTLMIDYTLKKFHSLYCGIQIPLPILKEILFDYLMHGQSKTLLNYLDTLGADAETRSVTHNRFLEITNQSVISWL